MKIPDLAELALRNLRESLLRNSLTTIGIRWAWLRWWRCCRWESACSNWLRDD